MQRRRIENTEKDIKYFAENRIDYKTMEEEETAKIRSDIYKAVGVHVNAPFEKKVLTYQGFDVVVPERMRPQETETGRKIPYVYVKRSGCYYMEVESERGITKRLNNLLEKLEDVKKRQENELEKLLFKREELQKEVVIEDRSYEKEIRTLANEIEKIDKELGLDKAS